MEKIDNTNLSNTDVTFKGPIPYWVDRNPAFMKFFYARDQEVFEKMPFMHKRVTKASREILKVDGYGYEGEESFRAYICPVRVKIKNEYTHPILLTYCEWGDFTQMLYWPMEMIPLSNEEREQVWKDFVKDDEVYYQKTMPYT